jgi:hypothetical protein
VEKMKFSEIIQDLGSYYNIGTPITHDKYIVYPVLKPDITSTILGLLEAEEKELAWIQESGSESVEILEAINKSDFPVLIPYLHQVEGGKQDRTVFEPILIPTGQIESNPLKIPAKCIEQSRWTYSSSRGVATSSKFKSAKTRLASQMANVAAKAGDQSTVWHSVGAVAEALHFSAEEAPTSSYREIQEKSYEKDEDLSKLLKTLSSALKFDDQVGIICLYGDKLLGIEIFGSEKLWKQFNELVLKGFLTDRIFLQKLETGKEIGNLEEILRQEFKDAKVSEEKATGSGSLFRFKTEKWEGVSIQYEGEPVHLYAAKSQVDIFKDRKLGRVPGIPRVQVQTIQDPREQRNITVEQVFNE